MSTPEMAVEEFYKLRGEYDKELTRKRRRIMRNPALTAGDKMRALSAVRGKCSGCSSDKGMVFSQTGTMLSVTCGAQCNLDIKVDRGKFVPIRRLVEETNRMKNDLEQDIIALKLNMVFGFEAEEPTISQYGKLKTRYDRVTKKMQKLLATYESLTTEKDRQPQIANLNNSIVVAKAALREIEKGDYTDKAGRMVRVYVDEIEPTANELRKIQYASSEIECPNNDCSSGLRELVQTSSTYQERLVVVRKPKLLRYVK